MRVLKRRQFTSVVVANIRNVVFVLFCDRMVYCQFFSQIVLTLVYLPTMVLSSLQVIYGVSLMSAKLSTLCQQYTFCVQLPVDTNSQVTRASSSCKYCFFFKNIITPCLNPIKRCFRTFLSNSSVDQTRLCCHCVSSPCQVRRPVWTQQCLLCHPLLILASKVGT